MSGRKAFGIPHIFHIGKPGLKMQRMRGLFVCLLLNGTSALFRPLVPRIVEIEHMNQVKNDLK